MNTNRASSCRFCVEGAAVIIESALCHPSGAYIHIVESETDRPIRERICRWTHDAPHLCDTCPLYEPKPQEA